MMVTDTGRPPRWYWVVAALALVWMLIGVVAWFMDLMMDEAALAQLSDGQRELYEARPGWLFVVYGVATAAGFLGAAALLLRQAWAVPAFKVSLAAVIVQFGYTFLAMDAVGRIGAAAALPFPLTIIIIGAALLWFSLEAKERGWIGGAKATVT
jgi:hypothetical protein